MTSPSIQSAWPASIDRPYAADFGAGSAVPEVTIWSVSLNHETPSCGEALLSLDERMRASAFRRHEDRCRFVAARATLRRVLGDVLECAPTEVIFEQEERSKPRLGGRFADEGIVFSTSRSRDVGAIAVARGVEIGIDVEVFRPELFGPPVARQILSRKELARYRTIPEGRRASDLCRAFVRKEAVLKACGQGLAVAMTELDFAKEGASTICQGAPSDDIAPWRGWMVTDVDFGAGVMAALASAQPVISVAVGSIGCDVEWG